jgi:hypothetical protein
VDEITLNLYRQAHERFSTALANAREIADGYRQCGCKTCLSSLRSLESIAIPTLEGQLKMIEATLVEARA